MHKAIIKKGKVRYYYNVVAANGQILSTSQKYFSGSNAVRAAYEAGYKVVNPTLLGHLPRTTPPPLLDVYSPQNGISRVTRFEVIDYRKPVDQDSRVVVENSVNVQLSYQDDGRTLKVFLRKRPGDEQ